MDRLRLFLSKDGQVYFFFFDTETVDEMLLTFAKMALDDELNFSWKDAADLGQQVQRLLQEETSCSPVNELPSQS